MSVLNFEPQKVFHYFEEITKIPHGSHNTEAIIEYCTTFAKERGLEYRVDAAGNVAIFQGGTPGYENSSPVIIQGHTDMVCVKESDCTIDMEKECIHVNTDGEYIFADGTSLGGDDGIAVAYALAILDSPELPHPPLEILLTNNEEVGLAGASGLEINDFKAKRLINLDSEEEGIITVSCAGACRAFTTMKVDTEPVFSPEEWMEIEARGEMAETSKASVKLVVDGLTGGHSGVEINKNRSSAIVLLGRILTELSLAHSFRIVEVSCAGRENVIPKHSEAWIVCEAEEVDALLDTAATICETIFEELSVTEPNAEFEISEYLMPVVCLTREASKKLTFALYHLPNGVNMMNPEIPGMVRSSLNTGNITMEEDKVFFSTLIRSNLDVEKETVKKRFQSFMEFVGATVEFSADYPAWPFRSDSPLRDLMVSCFEDLYGKKPIVCGIHAGLECGILTGKLGGLDMVSVGPDVFDVHSTNEKLSVASVQRTWDYLTYVLKMMK